MATLITETFIKFLTIPLTIISSFYDGNLTSFLLKFHKKKFLNPNSIVELFN